MIAITCSGCQHQLQVGDEGAGQTVSCPRCGRSLSAPAPAKTAASESPTLAPQASPGAPTEAEGAVAPKTRATERTQSHVGLPGTVAESTDANYPFLAPADAAGELGRLGPYHVLKVLGAGGMGVVFLARDPHLERLVALKAMLPAVAANPQARERFLREAKAAAALKHDHIVTIYQVGEDRGAPFLAMELLEGESLDERLRREGKLPVEEVLRIGREMAEGLAAAHRRGLIHRDIKPENVWLEGDRRRVKILDFGLVRAADDVQRTQPDATAAEPAPGIDARLTQAGAILGTPAFMSPEQVNGEAVDARCDLFSLGCVLYLMVTGELPFQGTNTLATLMAISTDEPRPPQEINSALPPGLCRLVMQLLAKKADNRPASARAVAEAIQVLEHEPAARPSPPAPGVARSWLTRHRVWAAGSITVAVALVCVLLHLANQWLRLDARLPASSSLLRQNWLPILFLLTLTGAFIAYCVCWRLPRAVRVAAVVLSAAIIPGVAVWTMLPKETPVAVPTTTPGTAGIGSTLPKETPVVIPPPPDPIRQPPVGSGDHQNPAVEQTVPDLVAYQPREEPTARIAVQADAAVLKSFAARTGELVIVVNYSLSMNRKVPGGTSTRIEWALDALHTVLKDLPDGVHLWVLAVSTKEKNPIAIIRDGQEKWSQDERPGLMKRLSELTPGGDRPLVREIAQAAGYFTSNSPGTKTILILTDGGDDEFLPPSVGGRQDTGKDIRIDPRTGKDLTMTEFLRPKLEAEHIRVHVVGIQMGELTEQGELIGLAKFKQTVMDLGGTVEDLEDAKKLATELQQYLVRIRFWIEDAAKGEPVRDQSPEGLQVTGKADNLHLVAVPAPGNYFILIGAYRKRMEERSRDELQFVVHVDPGDVLVLDLKESNDPLKPFQLQRDVYARSAILQLQGPLVPPMPVGWDWTLTVLGNTMAPNAATRDSREITLSLENSDEVVPPDGVVRQKRPRFVWFSVANEGDNRPIPRLRFYPAPNYPAPVWQLDVSPKEPNKMPGDAFVDAWWCEHDLPPQAVTVLGQGQFRLAEDLNGRAISVRPLPGDTEPSTLVVESVGVERHNVPEKLGPDGKTPEVDCLVVRLRYPPGRPYIVELPDELMKTQTGQEVGYEHRLSPEANMYTGVFYGVGKAQLANLKSLRLISLEAVKAKAVHAPPLPVLGAGQPPGPVK